MLQHKYQYGRKDVPQYESTRKHNFHNDADVGSVCLVLLHVGKGGGSARRFPLPAGRAAHALHGMQGVHISQSASGERPAVEAPAGTVPGTRSAILSSTHCQSVVPS